MEKTSIALTYDVTVKFSWKYPGKPFISIEKNGYVETTNTEDKLIAEEFINTFIGNYEAGICEVTDMNILSIKRVYTFDDWIQKYNPVKNEICEGESFQGFAFDYCNDCGDSNCIACKEWDFVKSHDPKCVWTLVTEGDDFTLISGFHWVNRHCYFVANKSVEEEDLSKEYVLI
jgi:hypothetical protein